MVEHGANKVRSFVQERAARSVGVVRARLARRRRAVAASLTGALLVATVVAASPASAGAVKVLQNTDVTVGSDGTITGIKTTNLRQAGDKASRQTEEYAPDEWASKLPVRVLTSYQVGDRTGTDLSDLAGESGRITIQLTVQNLTAKPELVEYRDPETDEPYSSYALVGTPMTVAAATDLSNASISEVVPGATDGVIGQTGRGVGGGGQTVQWAALLAPPRLAASSTFTLVVQATDFNVPTFDLSVQPGLIADTTVQGLINRAFGDGDGSRQALQKQTITLVTRVAGVLFKAGGTLDEVTAKLRGTASDLGERSVRGLRENIGHVQASAEALKEDLKQLESDTTDSLEGADDAARAAMQSAVDGINVMLGDPVPAATPTTLPADPDGSACADDTAVFDPSSSSILATISDVRARLDRLAELAGRCRAHAVKSLREAIGTAGDGANCASATTAFCVLTRAATKVGEISGDLSAFKTNAHGALGTRKVDEMAQKFNELKTDLGSLKGSIFDLRTTSTLEFGGLLTQLASIGKPSGNDKLEDLEDTIDQIHDIAVANDDADETSLEGQIATLQGIVCATPGGDLDGDADFQAYRTAILEELTGETCGGTALAGAAATSIDKRAEDNTAAWHQIAQLTGSSGDATDLVHDIRLGIVDITGRVEDLDNEDDGPTTTTRQIKAVKASITNLIGTIGSMAEASEADPNPCTPGSGSTEPLAQLHDALAAVQCQFSGVGADLDSTVSTADGKISTAKGAVETGRDSDLEDARQAAESRVTSALSPYEGMLTGAAATLLNKVSAKVELQRSALAAAQETLEKKVGAAVQDGIKLVGTQVGESTKDANDTQTLLRTDIQTVLTNLGENKPRGTGILGALVDQSVSAGFANGRLKEENIRAESFSNVRNADQLAYFLEQAQMVAALDRLDTFPWFGTARPKHATITSVFTFHVKAS